MKRRRRTKKARPGFAFILAVAAVATVAIAASAQTTPYASGTKGYDVSYPNCSATPPAGAAFGIVGVNGGRPFTTNSCFTSEYATAQGTSSVSVYMNTAYAGAYRKSITTYCASQAQSMAWQIGCSEADTSLRDIGSRTPAMWWLDVEVGNSWSTRNLALNQNAIEGAAARLKTAGAPFVGVYSTAGSWKTITGGSWTPPSTDAEWVAGGSCGTPFDQKPVWLSQQGTVGGVDSDLAC